jgi:hypothetical protein
LKWYKEGKGKERSGEERKGKECQVFAITAMAPRLPGKEEIIWQSE